MRILAIVHEVVFSLNANQMGFLRSFCRSNARYELVFNLNTNQEAA